MNYQECLDYLYQQLPMYQRIGNAAFKKSLDNIIALCDALGNPQDSFKTVHVAGTNGKGSSSHMLAAVLQKAGYKTGLYTSPHLKSFTERVRLNGQELPEDYLVSFVENNRNLFEDIKPSFFEMTVALAFKYFADQKVDVAVIEVGLGGRLDSTNIIQPVVSLITNIGLDHQAMLGNTLEQIAAEKAGIIKSKTPVVISTIQPETTTVFKEKAAHGESPIYFAQDNYQLKFVSGDLESQTYKVYSGNQEIYPLLKIDLAGKYQEHNLPGVLRTIDVLRGRGFNISVEALLEGLAHAKQITGLKGRWQVLHHHPLTICDTGHNLDGIKHIVSQLEALQPNQVHVVFGVVNDKDVRPVLELLPNSYLYYFCQANIPRALPVNDLYKVANELGLKGTTYQTVIEAINAAKANAAPDEVIFIGGSTFVVAEIEEL